MKKLTEDLKRMLAGLACQHSADYLPLHEKTQSLEAGMNRDVTRTSDDRVLQRIPTRKRVALISDGFGAEALIDYALHSCQRLGAQLDLLIHGSSDDAWVDDVVKQLRREDVSYHRVNLSKNTTEDIAEYIHSQIQLLYILAQPNDPAVNELMEKMATTRGKQHLSVPMVLIEHKPVKKLRRAYV